MQETVYEAVYKEADREVVQETTEADREIVQQLQLHQQHEPV